MNTMLRLRQSDLYPGCSQLQDSRPRKHERDDEADPGRHNSQRGKDSPDLGRQGSVRGSVVQGEEGNGQEEEAVGVDDSGTFGEARRAIDVA